MESIREKLGINEPHFCQCVMPDCRSFRKLTWAWKNLRLCFYFQPSVSEMIASCDESDECPRVTFLSKCH